MMTDKKPLLMLIDGYGLIFRAFYTVRSMSYHGMPTNALFGFVSMLLKLYEAKPDAMLVALDWHGKTARKQEYEHYKANREEAPDDLKMQIAKLRDLIQDIGVNWLEQEEHEADDVIGSLARWAEKKGYDVAIVTGDHDLCQLVDDNIKVWYTIKGTSEFKVYNEELVKERFGVPPEHVIDYKALVGDPSDNIPGVKGVGDKTAQKLLSEFPDIDEIYKNLDKIQPEGLRKKLAENKENAYLSRKLAKIKTNLEVTLPKESTSYFDPEGAAKAFTELGFTSFIQRLGLTEEKKVDAEKSEDSAKEQKWKVIQSLKELDSLIAKIEKKGEFAFDVETTSLDARITSLVGIAIAIDRDEGFYIPVGHEDTTDLLTLNTSKFTNLPLKEVLLRIKPLIESYEIKKIAQNAKFEMLAMSSQKIEFRNLSFDTMIASYILNPDERHNLKEMGFKWLGRQMTPISDLIGSGKKQKSMSEISIDLVAPYSADDASVTWGLAGIFRAELKKDPMAEKLFYEIELPMVTVLAEMEKEGIRIDSKILIEISTALKKDLDQIARQSLDILKQEVNLNSPKQLQELLFEKLNLPNPGKGSTNIEVLEEIRESHPIIPLIIEHRSLTKLLGTYADGLLAQVDPHDGRIHTSFNQTMTNTGRLSSSEPNLQNIPIRTEKGRLIRKAFIPNNSDEILLSADYSQIELRLLAHYSGDEALIDAFKKGEDIHARTAREILPLKDGVVTPNDRRIAKVVNFGVVYGMGSFSLSRDLGISRQEAQRFIDQYFARYPKVRVFFDSLLAKARETGYVETFLGRKRYMQDLNSKNSLQRANSERAAINMPLQGGAADIMKKAMVETREYLLELNLKSKIILQVHDEIVLSVKEKELEKVKNIVEDTLSNVCELKIPLVVNLKVGKNWYDMD
jgi:DNA polymerase-1